MESRSGKHPKIGKLKGPGGSFLVDFFRPHFSRKHKSKSVHNENKMIVITQNGSCWSLGCELASEDTKEDILDYNQKCMPNEFQFFCKRNRNLGHNSTEIELRLST